MLINKTTIYSGEQGANEVLGSPTFIGQIVPYLGEYGISKNPESFAFKGNRKYFADKNRGAILRLSRDGITEISQAGMRDYFKDNLKIADKVVGSYDDSCDQYSISLQGDSLSGGYDTLTFDEGTGR